MQQGTNARTDFQSSVAIHELLNELILQKYQLDFEEEDIPAYVYKLKQYLDEHFKETITLDQLEQQFLLNKYQLSKDFSKFIGSPPIDYLISKNFLTLKTFFGIQNLRFEWFPKK